MNWKLLSLKILFINCLIIISLNGETFKKKSSNKLNRKCERINIPLCQGVGYNMTIYPNSYGHETQEEAGLEVHQFYPLVRVNCYKHLKFFLCAMYTPICQDNYDLSVMPCREVCLEARKYCSPLMNQYGFKWPETLNCNRLPKISEQELTGNICAAPPDTPDPAAVSIPKNSNEEQQKNIPKNDYNKQKIMEISSSSSVPPLVVGIDVLEAKQCECKCSQSFSPTFIHQQQQQQQQNSTIIEICSYSCHSDAIYLSQDRQFLNNWISVWSGICLLLSLITVFSFLTDMSRFPYPERPIFFLSLCQLMVSMGFIVRVFYGHDNVVCNNNDLLKNSLPTGITSYTIFTTLNRSDRTCLTVFFLIYFFGMAGSCWWVILALTWVLAAVHHWSTEWISKYSSYFHFFAWFLPTLQTFFVLATNAVDGDPVSGICYVGNTNTIHLKVFVLGPLLVYFSVGVCFLSIGFLNLWGIRSNLKKTHPGIDKTSKLTQLMSKIGIFSVLYTVPALFIILGLFYEQHYKSIWHPGQQCSGSCPETIDQNKTQIIILMLTLIKTSSMLIVGWTSGIWILSVKTLQSWQRVFCGIFCYCYKTKTTSQQKNRRHGNDYFTPDNNKQHMKHQNLIAQQSASSFTEQFLSNNNNQQQHLLNGPSSTMFNIKRNNDDLITSQHHYNHPCSDIIYAAGGNNNEACINSPAIYAHASLRHCHPNIYNVSNCTPHRTLPYPEKV